MSLWADYQKEAFKREVYEDAKGFISWYKIADTTVCYIVDIYVAPEFRKQGYTTVLETKVIDWAYSNGCNKLLGSVNVHITTPERSMMELIKAGYKYSHALNELLYFTKDI